MNTNDRRRPDNRFGVSRSLEHYKQSSRFRCYVDFLQLFKGTAPAARFLPALKWAVFVAAVAGAAIAAVHSSSQSPDDSFRGSSRALATNVSCPTNSFSYDGRCFCESGYAPYNLTMYGNSTCIPCAAYGVSGGIYEYSTFMCVCPYNYTLASQTCVPVLGTNTTTNATGLNGSGGSTNTTPNQNSSSTSNATTSGGTAGTTGNNNGTCGIEGAVRQQPSGICTCISTRVPRTASYPYSINNVTYYNTTLLGCDPCSAYGVSGGYYYPSVGCFCGPNSTLVGETCIAMNTTNPNSNTSSIGANGDTGSGSNTRGNTTNTTNNGLPGPGVVINNTTCPAYARRENSTNGVCVCMSGYVPTYNVTGTGWGDGSLIRCTSCSSAPYNLTGGVYDYATNMCVCAFNYTIAYSAGKPTCVMKYNTTNSTGGSGSGGSNTNSSNNVCTSGTTSAGTCITSTTSRTATVSTSASPMPSATPIPTPKPCPANSRNVSNMCVCNAAYYPYFLSGVNSTQSLYSCIACAYFGVGFAGGVWSEAQQQCGCFGWNNTWVNTTTGRGACVYSSGCPSNSVLLSQGGPNGTQCGCNAGYVPEYNTTTGSLASCTPCSMHGVSGGSWNASVGACVCPAGKYLNGTECITVTPASTSTPSPAASRTFTTSASQAPNVATASRVPSASEAVARASVSGTGSGTPSTTASASAPPITQLVAAITFSNVESTSFTSATTRSAVSGAIAAAANVSASDVVIRKVVDASTNTVIYQNPAYAGSRLLQLAEVWSATNINARRAAVSTIVVDAIINLPPSSSSSGTTSNSGSSVASITTNNATFASSVLSTLAVQDAATFGSATASATVVERAAADGSQISGPGASNDGGGLTSGAIAGIVVGLVAIAAVGALAFRFRHMYRNDRTSSSTKSTGKGVDIITSSTADVADSTSVEGSDPEDPSLSPVTVNPMHSVRHMEVFPSAPASTALYVRNPVLTSAASMRFEARPTAIGRGRSKDAIVAEV